MIGRVVSDKTVKTVTVLVESRKTHPLYKKSYAWSKKYLVHNELGAVMGDLVDIIKCRPISKRKHWQVIKIVGKDIVPMNEAALKEVSQEIIEEVMPVEVEDKKQPTEVMEANQDQTDKVKAEVVVKQKASSLKSKDKKTRVASKAKGEKKAE